jgi:hypothetical protein
MCAVEAQRCVDCVSAVLHAVLRRAATLRAHSTPTGVLGVPGPDALCGLSTYLLTTTTETSAESPSDPTGGWCSCELGQNGARA